MKFLTSSAFTAIVIAMVICVVAAQNGPNPVETGAIEQFFKSIADWFKEAANTTVVIRGRDRYYADKAKEAAARVAEAAEAVAQSATQSVTRASERAEALARSAAAATGDGATAF